MNDSITLTFTAKQLDFLAALLQQVPYGQVLQAGVTDLLPSIAQQVAAANNPPQEAAP
jgi:hypothetical protein